MWGCLRSGRALCEADVHTGRWAADTQGYAGARFVLDATLPANWDPARTLRLDLPRFTLVDSGMDLTLAVLGRGVALHPADRHRGVALDDRLDHPAHHLNAQRQRRDVQQEHVLDIPLQNRPLDGSSHRNSFIRIYSFARSATKDFQNS
mgnify:CR=1 FL=1